MIDKQEIYHAISKYESAVEAYANRIFTITVSVEDFRKLKEHKLDYLWKIIGELENQAIALGFPKDNLLEIEVIKMIAWFYENSVEISKTKGGKVYESQIEHQKKYWLKGITDYAVWLYDFIVLRTDGKDVIGALGLEHGVWIDPKDFSPTTWGGDIARLVIAFRDPDDPRRVTNFVCGAYRDDINMFFAYCGSTSIVFREDRTVFLNSSMETYPIEITGYMVLPFLEPYME